MECVAAGHVEPRQAGVTGREAEVLDALAVRLTNAEIAERLHVSVRTVESHVSALLRKLQAPDRRALAALAHDRLARNGPLVLPAALADLAGSSPFVGRDAQVAALLDEVGLARAKKRRRLVLVTGEAGIGKSRLVAEFAVRAHDQGAAVSFGRCEQPGLTPYQPFVDAVEHLLSSLPDIVAMRVARPLAPLVPGAAPVATDDGAVPGDPELARYRLFEAFDAVLSVAAGVVVLVIDDLHWAERSTLLALRHLLRRTDRSALLVVAAVRPEGMDGRGPLAELIADLERHHEVPELRLSGLGLDDLAVLLGEHRSVSSTVRDLWMRTGGNPFLVTQLLHHLDELSDSGGTAVPPAVRGVLTRRLAGLDPRLLEVLTVGAVAGDTFRLGVAARALGLAPVEVLDLADTAVRAGLVTEVPERPDTYRFAHDLIREALAQSITTSRRAHLHLRLAEELERVGDERHIAEIAHHRCSALPEGDVAAAAQAARAGAAQALGMLAYEQAAGLYTMALEILGSGGGSEAERCAVLLDRGDARLRAGLTYDARADFVAAIPLAAQAQDAASWARAALGLGETSAIWGDDPELVAALEGALHALPDGDHALRARVRARLAQALYYSGSTHRREALSEAAVAEARAAGDSAALAWVLSARHAALWGPADLESRIAAADEIVLTAEALGDEELELLGLGWLVVDRLEAADLAGSDAARERHRALAERRHLVSHQHDAEVWAAMRAMLDGRLDAASEHIERARDLGETAHEDPEAEMTWLIQRFWLACEAEDPRAMDEVVGPKERVAARYPQVPAWRAALAFLHTRRGDEAAARAQFDRLRPDRFAAVPRDVVYVNALTYLAEACHFLGDAAAAGELLELLEPFADRVTMVDRAFACKGSVRRHLGLLAATLGDRDQAGAHLAAALAVHEQMGATLLAARTRREIDQLQVRAR